MMDSSQESDLTGHLNHAYQHSQTELRANPRIEFEQVDGTDWLTQVQQRQQALTGLQSFLKKSISEQPPNISAGIFCRLFSQEVWYSSCNLR